MKTILTLATAMVVAMTFTTAQAQTKDELDASAQRIEKLKQLMEDYPEQTGSSAVDAYGKAVYDAAMAAITNSVQLQDMYNRMTDETATKPGAEEVVTLSTTIAQEAKAVNEAVGQAEAAAKEVEAVTNQIKAEKNPMKKAKAAKQLTKVTNMMKFTADAAPILVEESTAQVKIVGEMVTSLKK